MKLLSLLACTALLAACSSTKGSAPPMSEAEMTDPMSGQWTKMREVVTIVGPSAHRMETYCQQGDAPEYHMMTLEFTR